MSARHAAAGSADKRIKRDLRLGVSYPDRIRLSLFQFRRADQNRCERFLRCDAQDLLSVPVQHRHCRSGILISRIQENAALCRFPEIHRHPGRPRRKERAARDLRRTVIIQRSVSVVHRSVYRDRASRDIKRAVRVESVALGIHRDRASRDAQIGIGILRERVLSEHARVSALIVSAGSVDPVVIRGDIDRAAKDIDRQPFDAFVADRDRKRSSRNRYAAVRMQGIVPCRDRERAVRDIQIAVAVQRVVQCVKRVCPSIDQNRTVRFDPLPAFRGVPISAACLDRDLSVFDGDIRACVDPVRSAGDPDRSALDVQVTAFRIFRILHMYAVRSAADADLRLSRNADGIVCAESL